MASSRVTAAAAQFSSRWAADDVPGIGSITGDRRIWLRATGSTLISQLIDSVVVTYMAFWVLKDWSFALCTALVLTAYAYKFTVALLSTPLVYLVHAGVERYLGTERAQAMRQAALRGRDEQ